MATMNPINTAAEFIGHKAQRDNAATPQQRDHLNFLNISSVSAGEILDRTALDLHVNILLASLHGLPDAPTLDKAAITTAINDSKSSLVSSTELLADTFVGDIESRMRSRKPSLEKILPHLRPGVTPTDVEIDTESRKIITYLERAKEWNTSKSDIEINKIIDKVTKNAEDAKLAIAAPVPPPVASPTTTQITKGEFDTFRASVNASHEKSPYEFFALPDEQVDVFRHRKIHDLSALQVGQDQLKATYDQYVTKINEAETQGFCTAVEATALLRTVSRKAELLCDVLGNPHDLSRRETYLTNKKNAEELLQKDATLVSQGTLSSMFERMGVSEKNTTIFNNKGKVINEANLMTACNARISQIDGLINNQPQLSLQLIQLKAQLEKVRDVLTDPSKRQAIANPQSATPGASQSSWGSRALKWVGDKTMAVLKFGGRLAGGGVAGAAAGGLTYAAGVAGLKLIPMAFFQSTVVGYGIVAGPAVVPLAVGAAIILGALAFRKVYKDIF